MKSIASSLALCQTPFSCLSSTTFYAKWYNTTDCDAYHIYGTVHLFCYNGVQDWLGHQDVIHCMCPEAPNTVLEASFLVSSPLFEFYPSWFPSQDRSVPYSPGQVTANFPASRWGHSNLEYWKGALAYHPTCAADHSYTVPHIAYGQFLKRNASFFIDLCPEIPRISTNTTLLS